MPTYQRFEELPVWQEAIILAERCEDFLDEAADRLTWSKRDQIDRASLSVSNNIAEGFERGTTNELLAFLYIARGSTGEVRSMLCYFERRPKLAHLKPQITQLKVTAESCSRQLGAWANRYKTRVSPVCATSMTKAGPTIKSRRPARRGPRNSSNSSPSTCRPAIPADRKPPHAEGGGLNLKSKI